MTDEPLIPYCDVVDLADVRIQRGQPPYNPNRCKHRKLIFANSHDERRIWCAECEQTIDPFTAFVMLAERIDKMVGIVKDKMQKADAALGAVARLRAVKVLDRAWSGNVMAVACPHCKGGLLPEDFARGADQTSREIEIARRKKRKEP
jgi:hypothetical protein